MGDIECEGKQSRQEIVLSPLKEKDRRDPTGIDVVIYTHRDRPRANEDEYGQMKWIMYRDMSITAFTGHKNRYGPHYTQNG